MNELHRAAIVADAHNDLLMLVARRPKEVWASYFREHWVPQLRAGNVDVQVLPVFIDEEFRPEGALRETLRMIEAAHQVAEANADEVALCRTGEEIDTAVAAGKIALVLALEGCPQIDNDLELLHTLHRLGVRMISFTHFGRSALADGSGEDAAGSRLTRAGVEAVGLLEQLGVLIDVSHVGRGGVEHILELATRPVVASHSSAYALRRHHRNLTDEQLRGIAATGGVVCANFFAGFLTEDEKPQLGHLADHLEHLVAVAGEDHVGLGSDFVQELFAEKIPVCDLPLIIEGLNAHVYVPGLEGPAGLPLVTDALQDRGLPETTIRKILGGNLVRVLGAMR
ncbi:Membrane dipeptidase [Kribbella flavida DSM 17836]|uniref:Membrane dipeptidase n=1 Tax=Kribbella flavida (strain DSM 17836 / JCM 10339 / NBRC 14399) TaxID=479435 RepID=D2PVM1_KRIFD|nr:dipeptidase [Kribbella flavida]ADB35261.1 Membrane dipeptidase [Kribbella flavida DSM 17836]